MYLIRILTAGAPEDVYVWHWTQAGAISVDFDVDTLHEFDDFCNASVWVMKHSINPVLHLLERDSQLLLFYVVRPNDPLFRSYFGDQQDPY
jgi:hypothetical protein